MKKNLHIAGLIALGGLTIFLIGVILGSWLRPYFAGENIIYFTGIAAILLIGAAYTFNNFLQAYVVGTRRVTEETRTILAANPAHRIRFETPSDIKELANIINSFADRFQEALADQTHQIEQAQAELEEEKNRLAALMSELAEGVVVCNLEGQILLYNSRARQLLKHPQDHSWANKAGGYMGLGRSIFGLIDRNTINYMLEDLTQHREQQSQKQYSQVVTAATNGQLIRTRAALVRGQENMNGFVLTLEDVTQQTHSSRHRDTLLKNLTEGVRSSLANIRSAIETIEQFPEMEAAKLAQLRKIIYDESLTLSSRLNQIATEYETDIKADWQLEEMMGKDLVWAIRHRFRESLNVEITSVTQDENLWLRVDSFSIIQGMIYMMRRLHDEFDITEVSLHLKKSGQSAALDLAWRDKEVDLDTIWSWQNDAINTSASNGASPTLREIVEHHGGEIWCQTDKTSGLTYIRLLLKTTEPKPGQVTQQPAQHSRPEYYDFDLFQQASHTPELDDRSLLDLTYTVFDTETTGLDPAGGDEIISISAVRIVNGRLLRQEIFDQLVDPKRPLPPQSTKITGISPQMVTGQPTIEQVLPSFHKFAEGTVLVAHNAAFDMRMLQLKETQTGVKFTNPVLDTLLFSAIIHANQTNHSLEAIAQRLGVTIIGRHTSLGDAILTGEIFLKLIPLLQERNIATLAKAREAAKQTYLARLSY